MPDLELTTEHLEECGKIAETTVRRLRRKHGNRVAAAMIENLSGQFEEAAEETAEFDDDDDEDDG